ncbi:MAG: putative dsRNA-binding protein [bacterium]
MSGPQHDPMHTVSVLIEGTHYGTGEGRTKKEAEQEAAREALGELDPEMSA